MSSPRGAEAAPQGQLATAPLTRSRPRGNTSETVAAREIDYPTLLRSAIKEAGSSRNKLGPELAAITGNQEDSEYRAIGKYLAGDETPSRERAAILAVLLKKPELALVSDGRARRQNNLADRLERLEADFAELRQELLDFGIAAVVRRAESEEDQELPAQRSDPSSSPEGK